MWVLLLVFSPVGSLALQASAGTEDSQEATAATESVTDWIQALSSAASAIITAILLYQVSLLKAQVKQGSGQLEQAKRQLESGVQWNKLNAAFTYFNSDIVLQKERAAAKSLQGVGFDLYSSSTPLTNDQLAKLKENHDSFADTKDFLNLVEDYCTAVRIGAIDEDAAYAMMSGMVIRWNRLLGTFIADRRRVLDDPEALCELERLATTWSVKDEENRRKRETELRRLEELKGVGKKV
jgi:hypothetical protein